MKLIKKLFKKALKKKGLLILFFLGAFFAFKADFNAAYFNYADFNFDEFAEENKTYWTKGCKKNEDENAYKNENEEDKCVELVLERQKHYYTRLYSLLAKYQKKGHVIDDNIIIMTSFFELDPDMFTDDGSYYGNLMGAGYQAYKTDDRADIEAYDIDQDDNNIDFFEQETDTLKLLLKNMVGYPYSCYKSFGAPTQTVNEEGIEVYTCPNGGDIVGTECLTKADSGYMSFSDYILANNPASGILSFFGIKGSKNKECDVLAAEAGAKASFKTEGKNPRVAVDRYWQFLEEGDYFDRKQHLQYRFRYVFNNTDHDIMANLTEAEKEANQEELIAIRKRIVEDIKALLDNYGHQNLLSLYTNVASDAYWWPVGSTEITADGTGKTYALGEPASNQITSLYGERIHPTSGQKHFHKGVDLGGPSGTSIIAAKSGIVSEVETSCTVGSSSCGGGYGNKVVIKHADGNSTVYAHLASVTVTVGESVGQGQVLGIIGTTGDSTGIHLHFEVHVNDNPVDPLAYISATEPRKASAAGSDLITMLTCLEGKGPDDGGSNYLVYDDKCPTNCNGCGGTLTAGAGVTLKWQADKFAAHGLDVSKYNYACALIPKDIVDSIKAQVITNDYDSVNAILSSSGISLLTHQIDALVSRKYNTGNINDFPQFYNSCGNSANSCLYDSYMKSPTTSKGTFMPGLVNRRNYEWNLFQNGVYYTC